MKEGKTQHQSCFIKPQEILFQISQDIGNLDLKC